MMNSVLIDDTPEVFQVDTPLLRRMVQVCGVAPADVEDVEQEVWLALVQRPPASAGTNQPLALRAWLARVVKRKAVDAYRRATRNRPDDLSLVVAAGREPAVPQPGPALALEQQEQWHLLNAALDEIRLRFGDVNSRILELRFWEEQSVAQVAATLGLSEEAVRVRQHRMICKLRLFLNTKEDNELRHENRGGRELPAAGDEHLRRRSEKKCNVAGGAAIILREALAGLCFREGGQPPQRTGCAPSALTTSRKEYAVGVEDVQDTFCRLPGDDPPLACVERRCAGKRQSRPTRCAGQRRGTPRLARGHLYESRRRGAGRRAAGDCLEDLHRHGGWQILHDQRLQQERVHAGLGIRRSHCAARRRGHFPPEYHLRRAVREGQPACRNAFRLRQYLDGTWPPGGCLAEQLVPQRQAAPVARGWQERDHPCEGTSARRRGALVEVCDWPTRAAPVIPDCRHPPRTGNRKSRQSRQRRSAGQGGRRAVPKSAVEAGP